VTTRIGVWIDHQVARIVRIPWESGALPQFSTVRVGSQSRTPPARGDGVTLPHLGGGLESHYQRDRAEQLSRFYDRVIDATRGAGEMVILGPGAARVELLRKLSEPSEETGDRPGVIACKRYSRVTDEQLVATVRAALEHTVADTAMGLPRT
jgi:hypothetical protein